MVRAPRPSPTSSATRQCRSVTAVAPHAGPLGGQSTVAITGSGFLDASGVSFGSSGAVSYTVNSATSLTAVSPPEAATVADVTVTTPVGTSAISSADQFTYEAVPSVTAVSPPAGLPAGGTSVVISGTGLTGASAVLFGTVPATSYVVNSAEPAHRRLALTGCGHPRRHDHDAFWHERQDGVRPVHLRGHAGGQLTQPGKRPDARWHLGHHHRIGLCRRQRGRLRLRWLRAAMS